jgi:hypothetical protein
MPEKEKPKLFSGAGAEIFAAALLLRLRQNAVYVLTLKFSNTEILRQNQNSIKVPVEYIFYLNSHISVHRLSVENTAFFLNGFMKSVESDIQCVHCIPMRVISIVHKIGDITCYEEHLIPNKFITQAQ